MFDSPIDEIKNRLDIVEVISEYIKLQKAGANYKALCPFHNDKNPSLFVSPSRQMWKCFGCGAGGSVFDFVMKIEGIEFGDALRILAKKAGVELKKQTIQDSVLQTKRQRLYEISEIACKFFERQLNGSLLGKKAKEYLKQRGLKEETIKKWRLGLAPDSWHALSEFLISRGYSRKEIEEAGLAVKPSDGSAYSEKGVYQYNYYDRFRKRIIFPIFDLNSQVIGFGGRILDFLSDGQQGEGEATGQSAVKKAAKYINTQNTILYDKSKVLYGLNFAKVEIRKRDFAIICEGYMDAILSWQAGFENTVASSGTALTAYQLSILKRYTSNIFTAFDMDVAGDFATKRGIDLAQRQGFEVKIITMPKGMDPADVASKSPKKWAALISKAKDINSYYFENALAKFDKKTPEGKKAISDAVLPKIKEIQNKILQYHWIKELAKNLNVLEESIVEELKKVKLGERPKIESGINKEDEQSYQKGGKAKKTRINIIEERALALVFKKPEILSSIADRDIALLSEPMRTIFIAFKKEKIWEGKRINDKLVAKLAKKGDKIKEILDTAGFTAEVEEEADLKEEDEFLLCFKQIESITTKEKMAEISAEIKKAEKENDFDKAKKLIGELDKLARSFNNINNIDVKKEKKQ